MSLGGRGPRMYLLEECYNCGAMEERVLIDSWTGREMCLSCWCAIIEDTSNSPQTERDNLDNLLEEEE